MCIQVFHNEFTCSMKSGVNLIGTGGVIPITPILLGHNPQNFASKKPIDRCHTAKLAWIQIFSFLGIIVFPINSGQTNNIRALRSRSLRDGSLSHKGCFAAFVRSYSALRTQLTALRSSTYHSL